MSLSDQDVVAPYVSEVVSSIHSRSMMHPFDMVSASSIMLPQPGGEEFKPSAHGIRSMIQTSYATDGRRKGACVLSLVPVLVIFDFLNRP